LDVALDTNTRLPLAQKLKLDAMILEQQGVRGFINTSFSQVELKEVYDRSWVGYSSATRNAACQEKLNKIGLNEI
jgi:hypothetical protein